MDISEIYIEQRNLVYQQRRTKTDLERKDGKDKPINNEQKGCSFGRDRFWCGEEEKEERKGSQ